MSKGFCICKMKCPLVGPFLGRFYFYAQTLQTMYQGCCMFTAQTLQTIPQRCFPPNLVEISSVVLEKKLFKATVYGRSTDGWRTGHDHHSSLEPLAQA